uniref:Non-specific serine/threonine protein kinase n=1 Tax=Noctiluca scintillans TaxID=2966 RepID=A0A7S1AXY2_NOCSC|mmetsp:Transcript_64080/g.169817  ORF Transcript_64080/g.169817 Transcript_64080/m.169817 type:complete len:629 (+) Transcript_64080:105-1991(+)
MGQSCNGGQRSQATEPVGTPYAPTTSETARREGPRVPIRVNGFRTALSATDSAKDGKRPSSWHTYYALGPVLGDGISAQVYEGAALTPVSFISSSYSSSLWKSCSAGACQGESGRRVAIKKFHRSGSRAFKKELAALQRVGTHPNILRLLESYGGFDGEDVLVLEFCDGSTVYDWYAKEFSNGGLPEPLITSLVYQLLHALEHLVSCGVEHQDVKPENMMMYDVSIKRACAELKLGDFGWATVAPSQAEGGAPTSKSRTQVAGSLWYAPPELNPPVDGISVAADALVDSQGRPLRGRSDMWSVGVVAYLLLVGHNPFNEALKLPPADQDNEVLRLAARANFNMKSEKWTRLCTEARDFVSSLLQVVPQARHSAKKALTHPFITRWLSSSNRSEPPFTRTEAEWERREQAWDALDGFQQLGWLAVARAVSDPELEPQVRKASFEGMERETLKGDLMIAAASSYAQQLAAEMVSQPIGLWLVSRPAWSEVLRLAFGYLDVDGDGYLSPEDLAAHVVTSLLEENTVGVAADTTLDPAAQASVMAQHWVARWQQGLAFPAGRAGKGLQFQCFRSALLSLRSDFGDGRGRNDGSDGYLHPSFSHIFPGTADHDEEEISWTDFSCTSVNTSTCS